MVFFFAAGFFYKKEYAEHPEQYIGKRLVKLGGMLFTYNTVFVFLHNIFADLKMVENTQYYGIKDIVRCIIQSILMRYTEGLLGTCWFLPMFFIGTALFALAFSQIEKRKKSVYAHMMSCMLFIVIALYANMKELTGDYWIQTSLLAVPVMYVGYFCREKWNVIEKWITWYGTILSAAIILGVLSLKIGSIELSVNLIINPVLFYPVTFLGIYFCMGAADLLNKNKYLSKCFSVIGKESFHIMALHFLGFKIVDIIYSKIHGINDIETISKFPHADYGLQWIYLFAGIIIPLGIVILFRQGCVYVKNVLGINNSREKYLKKT
mgnify:CR=1 FL=1